MLIQIAENQRVCILASKDAAAIIRAIHEAHDTLDQDKEHFYTILLDNRNRPKSVDLVSIGCMTSTIVHPREIFRRAIIEGAAGIVLAHNHPSGDPDPSPEDIEITRRLVSAGKLMGILVLDHIIIGNGTYLSFADKGLL